MRKSPGAMDKIGKTYLGDAVYIDFDGYYIVLTTEDGISETNRICLEPGVVAAFNRYLKKLDKELHEENEP